MDAEELRELLVKYIAHVINCEGMNFITDNEGYEYDKYFNKNEQYWLNVFAAEALEKRNSL